MPPAKIAALIRRGHLNNNVCIWLLLSISYHKCVQKKMATTNYIISVRANMKTGPKAWSHESKGGKLVAIDNDVRYRKRNNLQDVKEFNFSKDETEELFGVNVMPVPSESSGNEFTAVTLVNRGVVDIDFDIEGITTPDEKIFLEDFGYQIWPLRQLDTEGIKWRCFVDFQGKTNEGVDFRSLFGTKSLSRMSGLESSENHLVTLVNIDPEDAKEMPSVVQDPDYGNLCMSIWPNTKGEKTIPAISQGTFTVFFKDGGDGKSNYSTLDQIVNLNWKSEGTTSFVCLEKFDNSARFKIIDIRE